MCVCVCLHIYKEKIQLRLIFYFYFYIIFWALHVEFWCILNPNLIMRLLQSALSTQIGYSYPLDFFLGLYIYIYIFNRYCSKVQNKKFVLKIRIYIYIYICVCVCVCVCVCDFSQLLKSLFVYHTVTYVHISIFILYTFICLYIYIYKPTVVEGDHKAPFPIAMRYRERYYSVPWIAPFTLNPYLIMLSVKESWSTIFEGFFMTRPGIETRSPGPLANNLNILPMNR